MKRILLLLMVIGLSALWTFSSAQIQIGVGSTKNKGVPVEPYYGYTYSQTVYLQSEINGAGDITTLTWDFAGATISNSNDWTIYIGHTTKANFTSTTDWVDVTTLTQVYSGVVTLDANNKVIVDITDFTYNNTDNLIIAVDENAPGYNASTNDFYSFATGTAQRSIMYRNDITNPDPTSPPTANSTPAFAPNIELGGIVSSTLPPDCPTLVSPADAAVDQQSNTTATWTAASTGDPATSYNVYLGQNSGALSFYVATTDTSAVFSNLVLGTTYYWSISPVNAGGEMDCSATEWSFTVNNPPSGPNGITCNTGNPSIVVTEEMDTQGSWTGDISSLDGDWSFGASTPSTTEGPDGPHSGSGFMFYEASGNTTDVASAVSPGFDLSGVFDDAELTFWLHAFGAGIGTLKVGASTSSTGPFTNLMTWSGPIQTAKADPFIQVGLDLSAYIGSTVYIEFEQTGAGNFRGDLAIDLLEINGCVSCGLPSTLTAINIASNTADVTWLDGVGCNTAKSVTVTPSISGSPFSVNCGVQTLQLTGLDPSTLYTIEVTNDCSGNPSVSIDFTTTCATMAAPYSEGFENGGTIDDCWVQSTSDNLDWTAKSGGTVSSGTGPSSAHEGTYYIYVETSGSGAGNTAVIYSPNIDLAALTTPRLRFWHHMYGDAMDPDGAIDVAISTNNGATYTSIFNQAGNMGNQWNQSIVDLSGYSGVVSFQLTGTVSTTGSTYLNDFAIDDFVVEETPNCLAPTALTANNITSISAVLGWTTGGATAWEIVVQDDGTGAPTGPGTDPTTNPYNAMGLTSNKAYEFYVRDVCGNDQSSWTGPFPFTTLCGAMAVPYSNDFELTTDADCWSFVDANSDNKTWSLGATNTTCGSKSLIAGYSSAGVPMDDWAISPSLLMTAGSDYRVSFTSGNNTTNYTEKMKVFIMDGADPSTAMKVMIYNDDDISDNACYPSDIQVTAPAGWTNFYVGFHCYSDGYQYRLYLDDFSVIDAPAQSTWTVDNNDANSCDMTTVNGVAGNVWHDVYNGSDLVASVNSNGQDLGSIFVEMRDAAMAVEAYLVQGTTDMKKALPKFYNIYSDNTFTNPVTIRLYYTDGELATFNASTLGTGATTLDTDDIHITHYDGPNEDCVFSGNDAAGTYTLIDNANIAVGIVNGGFFLEFDVSSFSEFVAHEPAAAPLPITLSNFQGKLMSRTNMLTWSTETERSGSHFELQRAASGGLEFETIGSVEASGNTNTLMRYSFEDKHPSKLAYYRLKLVDLDGSYAYSEVISLLRTEKGFGLYGAYPVPTSAILTVEFTTEEASGMSVILTDVVGRTLLAEKFESTGGIQKHDVDMSSLAHGTYFVKLSDGQQTLIQRVVKQ